MLVEQLREVEHRWRRSEEGSIGGGSQMRGAPVEVLGGGPTLAPQPDQVGSTIGRPDPTTTPLNLATSHNNPTPNQHAIAGRMWPAPRHTRATR